MGRVMGGAGDGKTAWGMNKRWKTREDREVGGE